MDAAGKKSLSINSEKPGTTSTVNAQIEGYAPFGPVNEPIVRAKLRAWVVGNSGCGDQDQWACGRGDYFKVTVPRACYMNSILVDEPQGPVCRSCGGLGEPPCSNWLFKTSFGSRGLCKEPLSPNKEKRCMPCQGDTIYFLGICVPCGVPVAIKCPVGTAGTYRGCRLPYFNPYWLAVEQGKIGIDAPQSTEFPNECVSCNKLLSSPKYSFGIPKDNGMSHNGDECVACGRENQPPCKTETLGTTNGCYPTTVRYVKLPRVPTETGEIPPDPRPDLPSTYCATCGIGKFYNYATHTCLSCGGLGDRLCPFNSGQPRCIDPYVDSYLESIRDCSRITDAEATFVDDAAYAKKLAACKVAISFGGFGVKEFCENFARTSATKVDHIRASEECEDKNAEMEKSSTCVECPKGKVGRGGLCNPCGDNSQPVCPIDADAHPDGCNLGAVRSTLAGDTMFCRHCGGVLEPACAPYTSAGTYRRYTRWGDAWVLPAVGEGEISATVKAKNDIHIALSSEKGVSDPMVEIVIGGWKIVSGIIFIDAFH